MEELYVTLPSDGGGAQFARTNRNNNYKVQLPTPLHFGGKDWQVGLASLSLPLRNEFRSALLQKFPSGTQLAYQRGYTTKVDARGTRTVANSNVRAIVTVDDLLQDESVHDGASFMRSLVFELQKGIAYYFRYSEKDSKDVEEWKHPETNAEYFQTLHWTGPTTLQIDGSRCERASKHITVGFAYDLMVLLGGIGPNHSFPGPQLRQIHYKSPPASEKINNEPIDVATITGQWVILTQQQTWEFTNLNWGWFEKAFFTPSRSLRVYCNAGQSTIVGERVTDLLREVHLRAADGDGYAYFEPTHIQYLPVRQPSFEVMEVQIAEMAGALAHLGEGPSNLTLHFRQRV